MLLGCGNVESSRDVSTTDSGDGRLVGLRFQIRFHLQSSKVYKKDEEEIKRGLMLEYLSVGADEAIKAMGVSLAAVGFVPKSERSVDEHGVSR
jgi:hypothetical protein